MKGITQDAFDKMHEKIACSTGPMAIFVFPNGDVKAIKCNTNSYLDCLKSGTHKLVGIYDQGVSKDWLRVDIEYAEAPF